MIEFGRILETNSGSANDLHGLRCQPAVTIQNPAQISVLIECIDQPTGASGLLI